MEGKCTGSRKTCCDQEVQGQPGVHETLPFKKNQARPGCCCNPLAPALGKQSQAYTGRLYLTWGWGGGGGEPNSEQSHSRQCSQTLSLAQRTWESEAHSGAKAQARKGRGRGTHGSPPMHSPAKLLPHLIMVFNILLPECGHGG